MTELERTEARLIALEEVVQQVINAMAKQNASLEAMQLQILAMSKPDEEPKIVMPN